MTFNPFICTILSESFKILLFKDFIPEIIEFKVTEKSIEKQFSATFASIIFPTRSLNKVILGDSNRPNRIVQMNVLHVYITLNSYKYLMSKSCMLFIPEYIHQGIMVIIF